MSECWGWSPGQEAAPRRLFSPLFLGVWEAGRGDARRGWSLAWLFKKASGRTVPFSSAPIDAWPNLFWLPRRSVEPVGGCVGGNLERYMGALSGRTGSGTIQL